MDKAGANRFSQKTAKRLAESLSLLTEYVDYSVDTEPVAQSTPIIPFVP